MMAVLPTISHTLYRELGSAAARSLAALFSRPGDSGQVLANGAIPSVEDFGEVDGGVMDAGPTINRAIAAVGAAGGGVLRFNKKLYGIATDIVVDSHNVFLQGFGSSWASSKQTNSNHFEQFGGTAFKALPGCADVLTFRPVYNNLTGTRLVGVGMDGIAVDCNAVANRGVVFESVAGGWFPRITIDNPVVCGVDFVPTGENNLPDVNRVGGIGPTGAYEEPRDVQHLMIGKIFTRCWLAGATAAIGVRLTGDTEANSSLAIIAAIAAWYRDGDGLQFANCDGITVGRFDGFRVTGAGTGVRFKAGTTPQFARNNCIVSCETGVGGCVAEGTEVGTSASSKNQILNYSRGNGSPLPTIGMGAGLFYKTDEGDEYVRALIASPGSSQTPANNGDVTFQLTSNTSLTFKAKGSDGTVRSGSITLS